MAEARRFEITLLEELSSGTFARVYLAEARGAGGIARIVAVKVLHQKWSDSEEIMARTRDEAHLLARLRHKNIVRVEELTELNGQPAIIMEFVEGLDVKQLHTALKAEGRPFPAKAALQIAADAASALDAAWRRTPLGLSEPLRVVHRDIKPSNIMISVDGEVKVLDFGTARSTSAFRSAQTGAVRFGSWLYMSPERKEGERGDHSSDIYSLGLLTLELFSDEALPIFQVDPRDHDRDINAYIDRIRTLGMPNESWEQGLRDVLRQLVLGDPAGRPNAQQVAEVARQYAEQASGSSLDTLGNSIITDITQHRRKTSEGSLTGTRLWINISGSTPRDAAGSPPTPPAAQPEPPAQPAPAPAAPVARGPTAENYKQPTPAPAPAPAASVVTPYQPQAPVQPGPYQAQTPIQPSAPNPFDFSVVGRSPFSPAAPQPAAPRPAPVQGPNRPVAQPVIGPIAPAQPVPAPAQPLPAPAPAQPLPAAPVQPRPMASPSPQGPSPQAPRKPLTEQRTVVMDPRQVVQERDLAPPAPVPAARPPAQGGSRSWLLFVVLGVFVVGVVVVFALTVLVIMPRLRHSKGSEDTPVALAPANPSAASAAVSVKISSEGDLLQWVQVEGPDRKVVIPKAQGSIEGKLAAGSYRIVAKVAARPVVGGDLAVADKPLVLTCAPADKGQVRCAGEGLEVPVLLAP